MYECVYVFVYVYLHVFMYVCMYVCMYLALCGASAHIQKVSRIAPFQLHHILSIKKKLQYEMYVCTHIYVYVCMYNAAYLQKCWAFKLYGLSEYAILKQQIINIIHTVHVKGSS